LSNAFSPFGEIYEAIECFTFSFHQTIKLFVHSSTSSMVVENNIRPDAVRQIWRERAKNILVNYLEMGAFNLG